MFSYLQEIDHAGQHRPERPSGCRSSVRLVMGSTITTVGAKSLDRAVHEDQVRFEPMARRAGRRGTEAAPCASQGLELDAGRPHVPDHLADGDSSNREVEASLTPPAGGVGEVGREGGLAGTGGAGDQHRAAPIVASSAQHLVQPLEAARTRSSDASCFKVSEVIGQDAEARRHRSRTGTRWYRG